MKIAHLILTHKNPGQLERLLRTLDHPAFDFYIHVDKKSDITPFEYISRQKNVFFIAERAKVYWAGYGTIQATLNGFKEILPKKEYDYINVISAQDYPLHSPETIYQYLVDRKGQEFITCESIETEWQEAAHRVKQYHFINWRIPGKFRMQMLANRILPERKFPYNFTVVGRANWFTLSTTAIRYALNFIEENPRIVRYFKYCWGADEFIFSTILYNSPFREKITDNLVYVDWRGQSKGHPKILRAEDFNDLRTSGKLFARKFDMSVDADIVMMLEDAIQTEMEPDPGPPGPEGSGAPSRPPTGS